MLLTPKNHAPQARCYKCGSLHIFSVCHHCGTGMCRPHSSAAYSSATGKPISMEFADLGLEDRATGVFHCTEHDHVVRGGLRGLMWAGLAVAVCGILVALASVIAGVVLLLAGAGIATAAFFADRRRRAAALAARPPLPILPALDSVSVQETLRGHVRLDEQGEYTSTPQPATGAVEFVLTLAKSDRDRLVAYRSKYGLQADDPVEFAAGFGVLEGEAGLAFQPEPGQESLILPSGTAIRFQGPATGHRMFSTAPGQPAGQWKVRLPYALDQARSPRSVPIWFVPSLVPASDQRTLELDLHWTVLEDQRDGHEHDTLVFSRFEDIKLVVPKAWGNVESVSQNAFISNPESESVRTIQWEHLSPTKKAEAGSHILTIRFEEQINLADKLTGTLRASFQGTLSGVTGVGMYGPGGGGWQASSDTSVEMEASVDFELSLNSIRYQDVRVVPDRGRDLDRREVEEFPGVIPGYETVIELTNELSSSGYYVKRVIENPPRGGGRANLVNRYWDIAGRRYDGVFPIDFHLTLTGEEEYLGGIRANAGNAAARLTVHGSYANQAMKSQIEREWDGLHKMVGKKLAEQKIFVSAQKADGAPPEAPRPAPEQSPVPSPSPGRHASAGPDAARVRVLQDRLEAATDSLVAGRISEETFGRIEASIRAELGDR